jgi:ketosteroid isomerase-like protein
MSDAQNVAVIKDAYAAFGRGDVQGILDKLDDSIVWLGVYGAAPHVPMAGERRGKAQVTEFFRLVAEHVQFSVFDPREFVVSGDTVVALGHYTATTSAKKGFDSDFAMVFTMKNGKVVRFQEFADATALNDAYRVSAAA